MNALHVLYWRSSSATNIIGVFESRTDAKVQARRRAGVDLTWRWFGGPRDRESAEGAGATGFQIITVPITCKEN